ncbi:3-isopropylmalate dehydrogenase [Methanocella sp. CWC-04]|uniref:3-isopropylmalate dehydrogenase n=1 Tax=Methanooceanicella nereidis TaxID=2052831 RepID=A0AAP2RCP4_9EURY|nr:isocitrate/isopropylmalate dehydrogenase family protein [Methanocella sp. CWC-04]MCD1294215.1 3-isopropylmalate dehydrogenase [Methanocella sp. CWC-04]
MSKKVAIIKGDGVGPELAESAMKVVKASGASIEFLPCEGGAEWWEKNGGSTLIPEASWKLMDESDAVFKGPTTTPGGAGSPRSVAVSIRQRYDLYANVRPIKTYAGTPAPLGAVDFVCVREGTEGLYFGEEVKLTDDVYIAIRKITRPACKRIAKYAFEEATRRGWKSVVAIHKSNILKKTCGTFLEECESVSKDYPNVELEEYHIDNIAQQLVKNPTIFNNKVLMSTNLFMDVISEECSALVGSIGLIYSANIGDDYAMFEPAHGSAPKYKGMDKVNPVATVLAAAWMLDYLGDKKRSQAIFSATEKVIAEGKKVTYDMGGAAKSSEMVEEIIKNL